MSIENPNFREPSELQNSHESLNEVDVANPASEEMYEKEEREDGEYSELREMTDDELDEYAHHFAGTEIQHLPQAEVDSKMREILSEISERNLSPLFVLGDSFPGQLDKETFESPDNPYTKAYKAMFNLSATEDFKKNRQLQEVFDGFRRVVEQNPHMLGPAGMWSVAKDTMWRKDIPEYQKNRFSGSVTYGLAFDDTEKHQEVLSQSLDFENPEHYAETAHMLEAVKRFWAAGHDGYAEETVPDFYVDTLKNLEDSPESNYLLSMRAKEITSLLDDSFSTLAEAGIFPSELHEGVSTSSPEENENTLEERIGDIYDLSPEEKKEMIFDYEYLVSDPVREMIQREFQVELNDLSTREQFYFLNFLKSVDNAHAEDVKAFTGRHGVDGMRTFLSLEHDADMSNDILKIDQELDPAVARQVFQKYGEILDEAEDAEKFFAHDGEHDQKTLDAVSHNLSKTAKNVLKDFSEHASEGDQEALVQKLEETHTESALLAAVFKQRRQEDGDFDIENFENTSIEIRSGDELRESPEKIDRMKRIYRQNYEEYPEEFQKTLLEGLEGKLDDPNTRFYSLEHEGDIVAFDAFTEKDDSVYFGAFNVDSNFAGSRFGQAMMEKSLDRESHGRRVEAECIPQSAIAANYINKQGFHATGSITVSGVELLKIVKDETAALGEVLERREVVVSADGSFDLSDFDEGFIVSHLQKENESEAFRCFLEKRAEPRAGDIGEMSQEAA